MKRYNKASLFLMEMIIAIMFFALSSAICIQVFVKAKTINEESLQKSHAAMIASNIVETYKSDKLKSYYSPDSNGYIYFDDQMNVVSSSGTYKALLNQSKDILSITIYCENQKIYSIDCMSYQQRIIKKDVNS